MDVWCIWHPIYGTSSTMSLKPSQGAHMRRKRHEPVQPDDRDVSFGPPPEEYLYRCPVYLEEMLVNEAIIDVAIGAARCCGAYREACRRLGARDATARP
jgi:hypothetical protein